MITLSDLVAAQRLVSRQLHATPQIAWPALSAAVGVDIVVKHENHQKTGAFKARGGIVYFDRLKRERPHVAGIASATRGNHGQSIALAAGLAGIPATIVVPEGNSVEKNAAMRAFGAELIEHGRDFDAAKAHAAELAAQHGLEMVPSFHRDLVAGVGTYGVELFEACPHLDAVICPIGLGSGACGLIAARDTLGHKAEIWGVVSDRADGYARSFAAGSVIATQTANTFADGVAVRTPDPTALTTLRAGLAGVLTVSDDTIAAAIRLLFRTTHNAAEGAGAAALAAILSDPARWQGRQVAVVLSGGNIDTATFAAVLAGTTPTV